MSRRRRTPNPFGEWREEHRYRRCTWQLCLNDATDRYDLPFCQEHILHVWSIVERDMREAGMTLEKYDQQQTAERQRRERHMKESVGGFIYFLKVGDYIKIGHTLDLARRIRQYPPNSRLLGHHHGDREDEQELHRTFAAFLQSGREWYMDVPEIREHIARVKDPESMASTERRTKTDLPPPRLRSSTKRDARRVIL